MTLNIDAAQVAYPPRRQLLNSHEIRLMLRDLVAQQGIPLEEILSGTGVSSRLLDNPAHRLTLEQELLIYTRIARRNRDPFLGVRTGARLSLPNYGILGHAMMGAASLNEVLQLLTEFAPLVSWASHSLLSFETHAAVSCKCLVIYPTALDPAAAALEVESTFASVQTLFSDLLGEPMQFCALELAHWRGDESVADLRQFFGCDVQVAAERNALLLPRSLLSRRLPHPQPEYRTLFRDLCLQSMSALTGDHGLAGAIRSLIAQEQSPVMTLEQVAAHFKQSSRTLRRHLESQGISFRGLLDEVRYGRAQRYLASTGMTVESIATQLGYADARSFRAAFKRWAGETPAGFRKRAASAASDF